MVALPASIEAYLQEAGFSATELLILKKLLEGEAMTLRELSAKTGKSSGVLTQANRKLIDKGIMSKENINGTEKYTISSLEAIQDWVTGDMEKRHQEIDRKKQDFDAFLETVQRETDRPEMEFFDGLDGMEKAFRKLLEKEETEWRQFFPGISREEDDPLNQFRVQMFRERRQRKIFMRSLAPDVPLGRRYKCSDVYQYRKSKLIEPEDFPVTFEKYIVGDTVACFDSIEHKASFIHYPELADGQRKLFDLLWRHGGEGEGEEVEELKEEVPIRTRLGSAMRECFLSKKAMGALTGLAIVAMIITGGMYKYTMELMKDEIGERLMSIVATAAPEISSVDLDQIHFARDMRKDAYQRVYNKLNEIRDQNEDIWYAYVMRPTSTQGQYEFVADADSNYFLPDPNDPEAEEVVSPGTYYSSYFFGEEYRDVVLEHPVAEDDFLSDKWGTYLSAAAPIKDSTGATVAFIGVDMDVTDFYSALLLKFKPVFWFIASLLTLLLVRLFIIIRVYKAST